MEAEIKAKELIEKFWTDVEEFKKYETIRMSKSMAIDCALICVEEILSEYSKMKSAGVGFVFNGQITYWQEVKSILEKL